MAFGTKMCIRSPVDSDRTATCVSTSISYLTHHGLPNRLPNPAVHKKFGKVSGGSRHFFCSMCLVVS